MQNFLSIQHTNILRLIPNLLQILRRKVLFFRWFEIVVLLLIWIDKWLFLYGILALETEEVVIFFFSLV
jgi:hypothetical protein